MYPINNVEYFGRALYNNLKDHLNRSGGSSAAWGPEKDEQVEVPFSDTVCWRKLPCRPPERGGRPVTGYNRQYESARERPGGDILIRYHDLSDGTDTESDSETGKEESGQAVQSTTLNDF